MRAARLIAHYLPQFHPIPENDRWWGEGFTEWQNVRRARPLFEGHRQPREPGELGYYDLRSPDTRAAQAELARAHGVEAFCYWHYWFAGRRLLERPFEEVVRTGEPDFPFCLGWANHSWTAQWVGRPWQTLIEQTYPGREDVERHFAAVRDAMADDRYVRVDGRPLFHIHRPRRIPELRMFLETWRELAHRAGLKGIFFVGSLDDGDDPRELGLDGGMDHGALRHQPAWWPIRDSIERRLKGRTLSSLHQQIGRFPRPDGVLRGAHDHAAGLLQLPYMIDYELTTGRDHRDVLPSNKFPCAMPNWDNTPRVGRWGILFRNATPDAWGRELAAAIRSLGDRPFDTRLVFVKSWNEWAEGNYLEPDAEWGRAFLEATRREVMGAEDLPARAS